MERVLAAMAELSQRTIGTVMGMEIVQEALLAALLARDPTLAEPMREFLQIGYDRVPGQLQGVALEAFQIKIDTARRMLGVR